MARRRGAGDPPPPVDAGRGRKHKHEGRAARGQRHLRPTELPPIGSELGDLIGARRHIVACALLLAATLCMFGDVLFSGRSRILSKDGEDLASIFFYWLQFGFDQLRKGNLALWNPHIFAGAPFLGGFQTALLYPPNWLHLVLPLTTAINVSVMLDCFFAGLWIYLWTSYRRLHFAACIFAAMTFMFSGAYFLQIYRGHLSNLQTIIWAPLILLAVDGLVATGAIAWLLLGGAAIAMQILAGHVQYVFYTAVITAIYAILSWVGSARRPSTAAALVALYPVGACLAAVQLLPGIDAAFESVRTGLGYTVARTFAFPPENVVTSFLPDVFGDMVATPYWGRWTLSEMSLYISTAGLFLVVCGIVHDKSKKTRIALVTALVALVLSFGYYTPLFRLLYDYLPGFASFRGISKFSALATQFLVLLAAVGLDYLLTTPELPRWPLRAALGGGAALLLAAGVLYWAAAKGTDGPWATLLGSIDFHDEAFRYYPVDHGGDFAWRAGKTAAVSLFWGGTTAILLAGLWWSTRYTRYAVIGIALSGLFQLFTYAMHSRPTFDPQPRLEYEAVLRNFLATTSGDYRILAGNPYAVMGAGGNDLWGDDPMILGRYARFVASTQGVEPEVMMISGGITKVSPLFSLLRLRYVFGGDLAQNGSQIFTSPIAELPRALLVSRWRVVADGRETLAAMAERAFDPREVVFLEADPDPLPVESVRKGSVSVVDLSTQAMEIHADVPAPAILLLTENYSRGWRAQPLDRESRQRYTTVPADYTLLAIPLAAGEHNLRLEYAPVSFRVGEWVTLIALLGYFVTGGWLVHRGRAASAPQSP